MKAMLHLLSFVFVFLMGTVAAIATFAGWIRGGIIGSLVITFLTSIAAWLHLEGVYLNDQPKQGQKPKRR